MPDDKKPMSEGERDDLLRRIAFSLDSVANEGKNHGRALEDVRKEVADVRGRVDTLEKAKSDPTMADRSSEIHVDASAFDALPPYRAPMESMSEEQIRKATPKESIRVAALKSSIAAKETMAQTPMLEEQTTILKSIAAKTLPVQIQGILLGIGIVLASFTSTMIQNCNAAHPVAPPRYQPAPYAAPLPIAPPASTMSSSEPK